MIAIAHSSWVLLCRVASRALHLLLLLRESLVEARQARAALEADLFRGRFRLSSKNDDDLPIVR